MYFEACLSDQVAAFYLSWVYFFSLLQSWCLDIRISGISFKTTRIATCNILRIGAALSSFLSASQYLGTQTIDWDAYFVSVDGFICQ